MFTLYITILVLLQNPQKPAEVIDRQQITGIVSSEECERAATAWRLQVLENPKLQGVTVCIKK